MEYSFRSSISLKFIFFSGSQNVKTWGIGWKHTLGDIRIDWKQKIAIGNNKNFQSKKIVSIMRFSFPIYVFCFQSHSNVSNLFFMFSIDFYVSNVCFQSSYYQK